MDYIYTNLSPDDFEILCQDILSRLIGGRFERFKPGKDGGIDLRLLDIGGAIVAQVKHCSGSYGSSHKAMVRKEIESALCRIGLDVRYILITSLTLSQHNKSEILKLSAGLINSESDIVGLQEIDDFLNKNEDIVRRHYKLWLSSSIVLTRLLNNKVIGRSEDYIERVVRRIKMFVQTPAIPGDVVTG